MPRTVILIRCVEFDQRVSEMVDSFKVYLPGWTVIAVPDMLGKSDGGVKSALGDYPIITLPITDEFVRSNGLHYAPNVNKTGWLCGDYVLYRALEKEWDYAWVVEPDVFFLNGAEKYLKRLQLLEHDLLATQVWPTGRNWMWGKALDDVIPGLTLGAMSFPLLRCSRELALEALELRRRVAENSMDAALLPNDEVIVATAARNSGKSSLNIMTLYEEEFQHFGTEVKRNVDDLQRSYSEPLIVHSGRGKDEFMEFLSFYWHGTLDGNKARKRQFLSALATCNIETVVEFLEDNV
ncbi:hypothetical protein [Corynebacterium sp. HMSC074A09]|uniref:hypothetical protein n=1 Tax=Corynebacterium sp. HMSC074A09 TaxID=1739311 RepID=UPI0008A1F824|nr:hypothetical protein [Corynebacterium sp. HMSC074A09]OFK64502.1 hypothetical protein HMPREF2807_12905 [Corynebacterium sp. HMSC074A09]